MDRLNDLSMGRKLALGAALLLLISTFFAWQKVEFGIEGLATASASANAWHGFWGVLLGLLTIAFIAWLVVDLLDVSLPTTIPHGLTTLALGAGILACALLKNLTDDYSAWASYLGVVLAAGVAAGAWLVFQESGEALPGRESETTDAPPPAAPPAPPTV